MRRATLAALTASQPRLVQAQSEIDRKRREAKADAVILLWMAGGMPHTETFDPKRYTPFESGMKAEDVRCTFPAVPTKIDGVNFSEGLEKIGQVMDRGTVIRTHIAGDLGAIPAMGDGLQQIEQRPLPLASRGDLEAQTQRAFRIGRRVRPARNP